MKSYLISNDAITVVVDGQITVVNRMDSNFKLLKERLLKVDDNGWDGVFEVLTVKSSVSALTEGRVVVDGDTVLIDGETVPSVFGDRVKSLMGMGESIEPMFKFWIKLQENPSSRSVNQLWSFLEHEGIPLTKDGDFLAYKSVRNDFSDHHTGNHSNRVGETLSMPRNKISDDPRQPCHTGFHVGALEYASSFRGAMKSKIVICLVNPRDVVCVPYDCSQRKMRVCQYKVVGLHSGQMDSTLIDEEDFSSVGDSSAPKEAHDFDDMDIAELMNQSIGDLRKYATHQCHIIGASKIPGGKATLVQAILQSRYDS